MPLIESQMQTGNRLLSSTARARTGARPVAKAKVPASQAEPRQKRITEPVDWDDAVARAQQCKKCKPRKSGLMAGHKGCTECMGQFFLQIPTRPVPVVKVEHGDID